MEVALGGLLVGVFVVSMIYSIIRDHSSNFSTNRVTRDVGRIKRAVRRWDETLDCFPADITNSCFEMMKLDKLSSNALRVSGNPDELAGYMLLSVLHVKLQEAECYDVLGELNHRGTYLRDQHLRLLFAMKRRKLIDEGAVVSHSRNTEESIRRTGALIRRTRLNQFERT